MKENPARLHKVPGIGAGTMTRIQEILQTGSCRELQSMGERVPLSLLDLLRVSSLGPKKVKRLWQETGIQTLEQLREAAAAVVTAAVAVRVVVGRQLRQFADHAHGARQFARQRAHVGGNFG